ncbi:hypothetical protein [Fusobacterium sp.]|uniref:hypothetical protein n=1 Tax=Fusobacterium sp. TaxID=68766 RepID=UPI002614085E|nr:hypothetical protein [Fusobacterium sp.]
MKYNICGYSQEALIKYGLDGNDAILLRTIMDMYSSSSETLDYVIIGDDKYMWLTYGYLYDQIKIIGSLRTIQRKIDNFIEKNILKKMIVFKKNGRVGKYMFLAPGKILQELSQYDFYKQKEDDFEKNSIKKKEDGTLPLQTTDCRNPNVKMESTPMTNCHNKDYSITNNSIIDNKNNTHTEENPQPFIESILQKYKEFDLPKYNFRPQNKDIIECLQTLGADNLIKAFEEMGKSSFVKNNFSIDMVFKVKNLKSALNGSFKDRVDDNKNKHKTTHLNIQEDMDYGEDANNDEIYELLGIR